MGIETSVSPDTSNGQKFPDCRVEINGNRSDSLHNSFSGLGLQSEVMHTVQIVEGLSDYAEGVANLTNFVIDNKINVLFFLDKSARPAAHLFSQTWRNLFPDIDPPSIRFINPRAGITDEEASELRKRFSKTTNMDGKTIGVVDEFSESGATLNIAGSIIRTVFPDAETVETTTMFHFLPYWWSRPDFLGVEETVRDNTANRFLTTRYREDSHYYRRKDGKSPRKKSLELRRDLTEVARTIAQHTELQAQPSNYGSILDTPTQINSQPIGPQTQPQRTIFDPTEQSQTIRPTDRHLQRPKRFSIAELIINKVSAKDKK